MREFLGMTSWRLALAATTVVGVLIGQGDGYAQPTRTQPTSFTLGNGMQVLVIEDHRTPVVTHMVWYRVGSADEAAGTSGIAHFLEHLMFKGTAKHPDREFSKTVIRIGGSENAFTSTDYTAYFQRVPADKLATVMELEADRMTGLVLTDEVVLPERNVVLEEYNQRVANNPSARLSEQAMAALYLNHPYGRPIIGWRPEIEKLNRADALAFYRRHYAPNNALLVIAGDVAPDKVRELADATYAKIPQQPDVAAKRLRPQEPEPAGPRSVTLADPRVEQPAVSRYYLVPSAATASREESAAIEVLSHILGGSSTSLLHQALVVDRKLAISAGAWYQDAALDATQFAISAAPRPGVEFAQIEQAVDEVIAAAVQNGVTADQLERAKTQLVATTIYAQDSQFALARWYGAALTTGQTLDDLAGWPDRVRAVTADQVRNAARVWLDKKRSVTGYLIKDTSAKGEAKRS
jgi:zinc protease